MGVYYHVACHDCRLVGMLPKSSQPEHFADEWKNRFGHTEHNVQMAIEYDEEFDAKVHGREITKYSYYGPDTKQVAEPYKNVGNETMHI